MKCPFHYQNSLWTFKISMDDFVLMKVVHASCNLFGPLHQFLGRDLLPVSEQVEQGPIRAVLHHDAVDWRLDTHTPGNINCD